MKKICFSVVFALFSLTAVSGVKAQAQVSAFIGNWMLDKDKTGTSKDFPEKLKNYKMAVGENDNLLSVKSRVEGPVEVKASQNRVVSVESSSRSSTSTVNGVNGNRETVTETGKVNYGGTMALFFSPDEAVYNLNGEEQKVEMKQGGKPNGIARIKAKVDKSGKSMQFTTIRRMKTSSGEIEITIREGWKISEDGKSLKLQRTVEMPTARDEITMVLMKVTQ